MLKEKVIQYESEISTPNFNTEILKLIKSPKIKHEIQLSNGTIIQGTIIYENADQLILETQIGQLQINKNEIIKTNEVLPPIAKLEFIGDAIEEIYDNKRAYQGSIRNDGLKRADFVRIIYTMHDESSDLIAIDSAFISGSKQIFKSGIISDASIEPGEFSDFYVIINIEDDTNAYNNEMPKSRLLEALLKDLDGGSDTGNTSENSEAENQESNMFVKYTNIQLNDAAQYYKKKISQIEKALLRGE